MIRLNHIKVFKFLRGDGKLAKNHTRLIVTISHIFESPTQSFDDFLSFSTNSSTFFID